MTARFSFFQVGLNVRDMAAALRFYSEVFGFANGGGQAGWGHGMRLQGLEPSGQALIWWMVAGGRYTQLELFHHTGPDQRPQPADWSPADLGWVRMGIAVSRFDRVIERLRDRDIAVALSSPAEPLRRGIFRDPQSRIFVEVLEDGPLLPGHPFERAHGLDPIMLYATASVADLTDAQNFYGKIMGLPLEPLEVLHDPRHEALWGLDGAERSGFVARTPTGLIEVVEYARPEGRAKAPDYRFSDQGIMNIGFLGTEPQDVQNVIDQLDAENRPPHTLITGPGTLGTYVLEPGREVEFFSCPAEIMPHLGFTPIGFLGVDPEDGAEGAAIRIVHRDLANPAAGTAS